MAIAPMFAGSSSRACGSSGAARSCPGCCGRGFSGRASTRRASSRLRGLRASWRRFRASQRRADDGGDTTGCIMAWSREVVERLRCRGIVCLGGSLNLGFFLTDEICQHGGLLLLLFFPPPKVICICTWCILGCEAEEYYTWLTWSYFQVLEYSIHRFVFAAFFWIIILLRYPGEGQV